MLTLEGTQPLVQEVLEQALDAAGLQQRSGIVGLPEPAADNLELGEVQPAAPAALRQRVGDAIGDVFGELAAEGAREALEGRPDDLPRAVYGWWHETDALGHELGLLCQQRFEAREVVLTEGEEHLDAEVLAPQKLDDRVDDERLCLRRVVEQGYELLELVEDEQGAAAPGCVGGRRRERARPEHERAIRRCSLERGGQGDLAGRAGRPDRLEDELLVGPRLHAHPMRPEAVFDQPREQPRVDHRRLARPGLPVQQDAPVHRDQPDESLDLQLAGREDACVREPERLEATIRLAGRAARGREELDEGVERRLRPDAQSGISRPRTSPYSQGTQSHTSAAMKRNPCSFCQRSLISGSGRLSIE